MDRAIDLAIEGKSPYPEHTAFIDAESPHAGHEITRAFDEGYAVVLVSADGARARHHSKDARYQRVIRRAFRLHDAHAPARSRTWIYRLGGGRLIHWTTRAYRSRRGELDPEAYRRYPSCFSPASPASRDSGSPSSLCVTH